MWDIQDGGQLNIENIENGHRYNFKTIWNSIFCNTSRVSKVGSRNAFLQLFLKSEDSKLQKSKMASDTLKMHGIKITGILMLGKALYTPFQSVCVLLGIWDILEKE